MSKLKPIDDSTIIYASPHGSHYHLNRNCIMLSGGDFEMLGYVAVTVKDIQKRHLNPCMCAYEGVNRR